MTLAWGCTTTHSYTVVDAAPGAISYGRDPGPEATVDELLSPHPRWLARYQPAPPHAAVPLNRLYDDTEACRETERITGAPRVWRRGGTADRSGRISARTLEGVIHRSADEDARETR